MTKIKGGILKARLAFVEDIAGAEGRERVLAKLPPEDREILGGLFTASGWYPFEMGKRLDEAIATALGGGNPKFFERLGEASAEKNLSGPHSHFLVPGDAHAFLAKAPTIYSFYYDKGRRTYEQTGPREGVLTTYDSETFSAPDCLTVVGWYRKALQMCGFPGSKIVEESCRAKGGRVCRYRVTWP